MNYRTLKQVAHAFFFGNLFIGFCAVALCMETSIQHDLVLNDFRFYLFVFCSTVFYYTYLFSSNLPNKIVNRRMSWYKTNHKKISYAQLVLLVILIINVADLLWKNYSNITKLPIGCYSAILIFPLVGVAYNFSIFSFVGIPNLRKLGWLKPFVIGFVWSGMVSVFPVISAQIENQNNFVAIKSPFDLLWLKNLMFVSTLSIMFDLKDFEQDKSQQLNTFAVKFGVVKTIKWIVIPLLIVGTASFLKYTLQYHSPINRILVNVIPYLFLLVTAFLPRKQRSIIYYLFLIDGLMLLKAICGITGMILIK